MYCRKEMVKIFKCYLIPKKSYGTLSKGAIFFGRPCTLLRSILIDNEKRHSCTLQYSLSLIRSFNSAPYNLSLVKICKQYGVRFGLKFDVIHCRFAC